MSAAKLFDETKAALGLKRDADLARMMGTYSSNISKMRGESAPVSASLIVRIHEETGWPTRYIKALIAGTNEGAQA